MRARVLALGFITLTSLMLCVYVLAGAQRTAAAVPKTTPPNLGDFWKNNITPYLASTK